MLTAGARLAWDADGLNTAWWPPAADQLITPVEQFFTRSHAPVPQIDVDGWRLDVGGLVTRPAQLALADLLDRFPRREVTATLVCAGLRRSELLSVRPLPGELPWGPEPTSTGVWGGVALRDVLEAAGVADGAQHVEFVGADRVERYGETFGFGGSIPLEKALSDEVLLATTLNGAPLTPAHGFPVRTLVPGWIGARCVKWLARVTVGGEPSTNYFQRRAYRVQRLVNRADPRDVSQGTMLEDVPVNAVIVAPAGGTLRAGVHVIRGWAIGSGACALASVDVSLDDGRTWRGAEFERGGPAWTWRLWRASVALAPGTHTLCVRATDVKGRTQPGELRAAWNVKGYCNNAWHRVPVRCE